jgi:hypothetical protein
LLRQDKRLPVRFRCEESDGKADRQGADRENEEGGQNGVFGGGGVNPRPVPALNAGNKGPQMLPTPFEAWLSPAARAEANTEDLEIGGCGTLR